MTPFRFSVVIPTFQRREVVLSSVRALSLQEGAEPFEVIVVDDGSNDGSAAGLRKLEVPFPLTVIEQPNRGSAAARHVGATAARGELLMFLDDDMEAHPRLLAEHDSSHRAGADVVFGDIPLHPDSPEGFLAATVGRWVEERRQSLIERGGRLDVTDFLTGQMSLRRELYHGVGGFDLNFTRGGTFGGADYDFGQRLADAGYKMVFNPDAISWQRYVVTPRRLLRQWRDNGRARVMLARKHPETRAKLLDQRELLTDRFVWRWFRWPLRELALALVAAGPKRGRPKHWFYRVQNLQYFAGIRAAGGVPEPRPVRVLCYHAVADLKGARGLEPYGVPPERFRRQMRFLARWFHFIDGQEFRAWLEGGGVPRRAVLLTFDDGLEDLRDAALPVLREFNAPALAFAVTSLLGGTSAWNARHGHGAQSLMDANGLRAVTRAEVAIGVHTRTHPMLTDLSAEEVSNEIEGSIADLEALSFERPLFLAYPYGGYNIEAKRAAAAAGLAAAFTTRPGLARPGCDRYAIPRIEIFRADRGLRFVWKLVTARQARR